MNTKIHATCGGLLILLVLTIGASFVLEGTLGVTVSLVISALKTTLIAAIFMELISARSAVRLAASSGLLWLAILLTCVMADYSSRGWKEAAPHWLDEAEHLPAYDRIEP